jgi:hypothetical protein
MSRTLKAIERHMTQPSKSEVVERSAPKLVGEWQQRGPGNVVRTHAKKIAVGLRAFAISQTANSQPVSSYEQNY